MARYKLKRQPWEQPAWAGKSIKTLQRKTGLNLAALGRALGIPREQISRFKHNKRPVNWLHATKFFAALKNPKSLTSAKTKKA